MSLIELLVVMVILGIAIGMLGLGISLIFSRDAERCAKLIDMGLEKVRMSSLSKEGKHTLTIDSNTSQLTYIRKGAGADSTALPQEFKNTENLPAQTDITFWDKEGALGVTGLVIKFDKEAGKVIRVSDQKGAAVTESKGSGKPVNMVQIQCKNRNGKVATVVLIINTGKHYVKYAEYDKWE